MNFGSRYWNDILRLLIGFTTVIIVNQLSDFTFFRFDLTEEKRFTISEPTRETLRNLDDVIYLDIYLAGDLPAGFKRMQKSVLETLEEFAVYSDNRIQYSLVDPYAETDQQTVAARFQALAEKGVTPTDVFINQEGNSQQRRILPGVLMTYAGIEKGVNLLKGNVTADPEVRLNQSIEGIEYELISAIREMSAMEKSAIGFVTGHGELSGNNNIALRSALNEKYLLNEVRLDQPVRGISTLIIAKPNQPFTNIEKYHLDQFIVKGGNVVWMLQGVNVELDSIREGTVAFPSENGLDDLLFRYGVRINSDLIQDVISGSIPIVVGQAGEAPQVRPLPWPYYPILNNFADHPITRNMDAVQLRFASTIDTVRAEGIRKTPLLFTSGYSRTLNAPVLISLESLRKNADPDKFTQANIPVGYLLEGSFTSAYSNRLLPEGIDKESYIERGKSSKMVVFSDADLGRNELDPRTGNPLPLGRDPFAEHQFANLDLILNSISYLTDQNQLILARNRQIAIRPLDKVKVAEERLFWQVLNIAAPLILLLIAGLGLQWIRRKRFAHE